MGLDRRIEKLEIKNRPGTNVTVIFMEKRDETDEQAIKRHYAEKGITAEERVHRTKLMIIVNKFPVS